VTESRVDAVAEWRSRLSGWVAALLLFEMLTGILIFLLPFSAFPQAAILLHTLFGLAMIVPLAVYTLRHWRMRRSGRLSHHQLLGYVSAVLLIACCVSGSVLTWQGLFGTRLDSTWDLVHLITGMTVGLFLVAHLATVIVRRVAESSERDLRAARGMYWKRAVAGCGILLLACIAWSVTRTDLPTHAPFPEDYNWSFGEERPFAPSLARIEGDGVLRPETLAGSRNCGTNGCHEQIVREWLPSAHRYSSLDDMFQRVQVMMAAETTPEHTRYCAGCHDPISLFGGAKNASNITLSSEGSDEGASCLVCHSIVQADTQGNADYTIRAPERYAYEDGDSVFARTVSDFLIRVYPDQHIASYSRPLYKTAEFCAACHKQYIDKEVNTDIGRVQGQNQYDSWKNSRWHHEDDATKTITCRECHMPLIESHDPARGDRTDDNRDPHDGMHRSHRMLASNQYIPLLHGLEGAQEHVELTEHWLRGEIEIPEIAHKWTAGPVVRLELVVPQSAEMGSSIPVRVILTNNKTGHDFPTGPLDMIESWIEITVTDSAGKSLLEVGTLGDRDQVVESPAIFKANGFDRQGELIDRHNLWDLVGASYKRALYPGVTDTVEMTFQCPSMARGRVTSTVDRPLPDQRIDRIDIGLRDAPDGPIVGPLTVTAVLKYRKANPDFLDRAYGKGAVRSPITELSRASATIELRAPGERGEVDESDGQH